MSQILLAHAPLDEVLKQYRDTVLAKDLEGHLALYDEDVLIFDMWGDWSLKGMTSLRKMVKEWFSSLGNERVAVEMEDFHAVASGELGYVTATVKYTALSPAGETLRSLQNRFSAVLQLKNGTYKIVHQHTSGPADPDTLTVSLRR